MGVVVKPNTFAASTTALASEVNSNFDTLYTLVNGNLEAANLANGAVTENKLGALSVSTGKIAAEAVTDAKVAAGISVNKLEALTASIVPITDASGFLSSSAVTPTELGYVSGVTSAIQTQLDSKAASVDRQVFTSSGTWNKPSSGTIAIIEVWGGGGAGADDGGAGGGGGGYARLEVPLSALGGSETVTVGAGGTPGGSDGGTSSFGTHLSVTGGINGSGSVGGTGGGFGGGASNTDATSIWGGGGGGTGNNAGSAAMGGGGGAAETRNAGNSIGGGDGGAGSGTEDGNVPAGGGQGGASPGAGARGEVRVTVV